MDCAKLSKTFKLLKVLEMGPLTFSEGDFYKNFTRPFQLKMSSFIKVTFLVGKVL